MFFITMDTNFLNISRFNDLTEFRLNSDFYKVWELQNTQGCIDTCRVLLPEVVYRELVQHECEAYRKAYDVVRKYAEQLGNLVDCRFHYEPEEYENEIEARANHYICEEQIEILPVCEEKRFKNILDASIQKQPPFEGVKGKADKGFKDAVIWYSLIDYAKEHAGDYIFITNDKIFLDNDTMLRRSFEAETGSKVAFYRDVEEVKQNIIMYYEVEEISSVDIFIQEKEWEIYNQDKLIMNTTWKLPVVKKKQSDTSSKSLSYINNCIRRYYEDVKEEWMRWKQDLAEEKEDSIPEPYSDGIGFRILLNQSSILCIRFERFAYTGGWHPIPLWKVFTFDLNSGRQLELKDVMNISEEEIYALAVKRLKEEQIIHSSWENRPFISEDFSLENYHNSSELKWFINPEGVHIYFDVYEASSYSEGFIQFRLSDKVYRIQGDRKISLSLDNNNEKDIEVGCR